MADGSATFGSSAMKSSGPSMSMIENSINAGSVGVGNYKGVMLCNRPFGGSTVANKQPNNASAQVFNCGVVPEAMGLNVPISATEKLSKRPKKDSVLAKHKKWLIELQKTKDRLEVEYMEDLKRKEETQQKFQEVQKKMRDASRTIMKNGSGAKDSKGDDSKDETIEVKQQLNPSASAPQLRLNNNAVDAALEEEKAQPKTIGAGGRKTQFKPAWAMTEKAADDQLEDMKLEEEDDLIDFARGLDFDRYIGDVEVQTMMAKLRSRISELEKEVELEDQRESDAESRAALRAKIAEMGKLEAGLSAADAKEVSAESAAMNAARALLDEEEDMKAVHSTKSAATLLLQAKEKIESVRQGAQGSNVPEGKPYVKNEPLIVVHEPNEGARLGDKNLASNLPYLRRNPAAV